MPQSKKKPAAKSKPAAKRPPEPEIQMVRGSGPPEETQEERDAAGADRREKVLTPGKPDAPEDYEPKHKPLEHADFDHHAAEKHRQAELQYERDVHNDRTGDASLS